MSTKQKHEKKNWTTPTAQRFGSFAEATRNVGHKALGVSDGDITATSQSLASV